MGIAWLTPAYLGMCWLSCVCVGLLWRVFAYLCVQWPTLASFFYFSARLAYICTPLLIFCLPWLFFRRVLAYFCPRSLIVGGAFVFGVHWLIVV